jgi:hypothetical protein
MVRVLLRFSGAHQISPHHSVKIYTRDSDLGSSGVTLVSLEKLSQFREAKLSLALRSTCTATNILDMLLRADSCDRESVFSSSWADLPRGPDCETSALRGKFCNILNNTLRRDAEDITVSLKKRSMQANVKHLSPRSISICMIVSSTHPTFFSSNNSKLRTHSGTMRIKLYPIVRNTIKARCTGRTHVFIYHKTPKKIYQFL